jgi:transposase
VTAKHKRKRRTFDNEFKQQAVRMMLDGYSASSVAENLGIENVNLLYRWKSDALAREGDAASTLDARVRQLEEEVKRLERERDVLKKALAILSRTP